MRLLKYNVKYARLEKVQQMSEMMLHRTVLHVQPITLVQTQKTTNQILAVLAVEPKHGKYIRTHWWAQTFMVDIVDTTKNGPIVDTVGAVGLVHASLTVMVTHVVAISGVLIPTILRVLD
jgi:hypothetical protein